MYSGFCVRVLVVSLLTFGQHRNALGYKSGGSSGIKPFFGYSTNHKLPSASGFESSAQPGGFLGSYGSSHGSSHSEGGLVDRYSPKGSVSSYGSGPLINRKPTQNSQKPPQAKSGMWDLVLPQNGKIIDLGIASSKGIIMHAGSLPQPSTSQHQHSRYQHSRYQPKPQHSRYQQSAYQPQRGGVGGVSGPDVQPANLNVYRTVPPRTRQVPLSSRHSPRWQQSLVPV